MNIQLRLVIHNGRNIFDNLVLTPCVIIKYIKGYTENQIVPEYTAAGDNLKYNAKFVALHLNRKGFNAYLVSAYVTMLKQSNVYRNSAVKSLLCFSKSKAPKNGNWVILIKLQIPKRQFLDYKWNEKILYILLKQREIDHALSWLSTLGGGFSALGEQFEHCAKMAGKISVRQLELALQLGDPLLVARCKLYSALSLLQCGHLKLAKQMVLIIYRLAIDKKDTRLQKMCKGVWAKLQYSFKLKKLKKL